MEGGEERNPTSNTGPRFDYTPPFSGLSGSSQEEENQLSSEGASSEDRSHLKFSTTPEYDAFHAFRSDALDKISSLETQVRELKNRVQLQEMEFQEEIAAKNAEIEILKFKLAEEEERNQIHLLNRRLHEVSLGAEADDEESYLENTASTLVDSTTTHTPSGSTSSSSSVETPSPVPRRSRRLLSLQPRRIPYELQKPK